MNEPYTTLLLGGGPIAASTAYFLTQDGATNIGLVTQDPIENRDGAYMYAGGSVRWFWDDELKKEMTTETGQFILDLDAQGVDLSLLKDNYLFLGRGKFVPSLNISGKKLVQWFLGQASQKGLQVHNNERIVSVTKNADIWNVKTETSEYFAHKVLLALGVNNGTFMPGFHVDVEKRELFVLDLPVTKEEEQFPHTIIPLKEGVVYVFIKKFGDTMKFVVGQEDAVEPSENSEDGSTFAALIEAGLGEFMPFLKKAKIEMTLWGFDAGNKTLTIEEREGLFAVNCGSAIRGCVWIGKEIAKRLK